ncbi:MAG TPA: hypothetical protein VGL81_32215 [Polyangiaceae bacterium]|jgi:hypothetical protein
MPHLHSYPGSCHCGAVCLRLESDKTPSELGLRTDTCSFCTKHEARYTSDPGGALHFAFRDAGAVTRYRFGTRTADFLFCKACGIFVAATMPEAALAVVNVHVLDARAEFLSLPLHTADFDGESVEQRLARRQARWTPLVPTIPPAPPRSRGGTDPSAPRP